MRSIPAPLRRHIAKIEMVEDARGVQNGWWVYLRPGWIYDGVHQIHEDTLADCASCLASSDKCECAECLELVKRTRLDGYGLPIS